MEEKAGVQGQERCNMDELLISVVPKDLCAKDAVTCIYTWICKNIKYDAASWKQGITQSKEDISVTHLLRKKTATCKGFAALFAAMCRTCGIDSYCVLGCAKGCGYIPGSQPNHVWNVVCINHQWYHVDCSWGAGYLSKCTTDFVFDYNDYYLLCEPENFIRDHFPLDSRWQLLKTPISLEAFEAQAYTKPAFYRFGLASLNPDKSILASNGSVSLSFTSATSLDYTYTLCDLRSESNYSGLVTYSCVSNRLAVEIVFPRSGKFVFTLYGKEQRTTADFQSLITYSIVVDKMPYVTQSAVIDDILSCHVTRSTSWGWTSQCSLLGLAGNITCSHLEVTDGQCSVTLRHEPLSHKVFLKATLYNLGRSSQQMRVCPRATNITSRTNEITIKALPPHPGTYSLVIRASDKNTKPLPCIAKFLVINQPPSTSFKTLQISEGVSQGSFPDLTHHWNMLTASLVTTFVATLSNLYKLTFLFIPRPFRVHHQVS